MNTSRRKFMRHAGLSLGAVSMFDFSLFAGSAESADSQKRLDDFDSENEYWEWVRQSYTVSSNLTNLNNGGVSPQPKVVQDVFEQYNRMSNEGPSYYMWRVLDKGREAVRTNLAELAGCEAEEIAIQRNATEALDTIIFGLNLQKGDEIIVTNYDYPNMRNAWLQREKRDGIKLIWISIPLNPEDDDAVVKLYEDAITSKTKIIHITHIINWTGQILPAKKIAEKAHAKNVEVVLDAAHSFAHLDFSFRDLDCDYAGTSLHKWLCAPFGTGMLYIKKEKIASIWPIFPTDKPDSAEIKKFEALGTRSFPAEMAVGRAISFHNSIGIKRKAERLKFLQQYWVNKVKDHPKIKFYTPLGANSCAIATVGIEGMQATEIEAKLFENRNIHTVSIVWEGVNGIRVTPHVYTSTRDLDNLVEGLLEIAG
jgi:selenocysteine lyase/cysteine desulfurase